MVMLVRLKAGVLFYARIIKKKGSTNNYEEKNNSSNIKYCNDTIISDGMRQCG